uniref:Uncharacterized protein n=1 Tax=Ascaris lumbricoides TaxID=6252 RepID=A0A0M3ID82_ASCLU
MIVNRYGPCKHRRLKYNVLLCYQCPIYELMNKMFGMMNVEIMSHLIAVTLNLVNASYGYSGKRLCYCSLRMFIHFPGHTTMTNVAQRKEYQGDRRDMNNDDSKHILLRLRR